MLIDWIRFLFDFLILLMILFTCIRSFAHAWKGHDIAGVTFGMAFFVLLVSKVVHFSLFIATGFKFVAPSHINEYLWWYVVLSYVPFAVGCFVSIFASGKLSSIIWAPAILLSGAVIALPFIERLFPVIASFQVYGSFAWLVTAVFLFAASLTYFFYHYKAADQFRLWMGIGFLLLAISSVLGIISGTTGILYLVAMVTQFVGFFIVYYEISHT